MSKTDKVRILFEDMSFGMSYSFLEIGKDDTELVEIGKKFGLDLPSPDLAIFKGRYAMVDEQNRNHCSLPRPEVEKALTTLRGKAVDIDHMRKNTRGYWLGAEIDSNDIIAYGAYWKSNYAEEYNAFKERMDKGKIKLSFEAWGQRNYKNDKEYDLTDIHFAGGAILSEDVDPAFPDAEILEFSNNRVLEFAKVIESPVLEDGKEPKSRTRGKCVFPAEYPKVNDNKDHFPINDVDQARNALARVAQYSTAPKWYNGPLFEVVNAVKRTVKSAYPTIEVSEEITEETLEKAKMYLWDIQTIGSLIREVNCLNCDEKGFLEIDQLNFRDNETAVHCNKCDSELIVKLTPKFNSELTKQGRVITQIGNKKEILDHDSAQAKAGDKTDTVEHKSMKEEEQSMKTLIEKYKVDSVEKALQEVAKVTIQKELTQEELQFAYTLVEYRAGGGEISPTSLMSLKGKSVADPVSLVAAKISEDDVIMIIKEITKAVETLETKPIIVEPAKVEIPIPVETNSLAEAEVIKLKAELKQKDEEMAILKVKVEKIEKAEKEAEDKKKADLIKTRKDELGEFGKEFKDEDFLNEDKYKIARQAKLIAKLSEGKTVEEKDADLMPKLTKGSADKDVKDEETEMRKRIRDLAWSETEEKEDKA